MFLFIFGVMFFDLFLLKEMIQCNFSIQFDFIYNSIYKKKKKKKFDFICKNKVFRIQFY